MGNKTNNLAGRLPFFFQKDYYIGRLLLKRRGLAVITWVYLVLLVYIIAALVYWFIVLEQQNNLMAVLRVGQLQKNTPGYAQALNNITALHRRKMIQYIGEGSTFLVLIIFGASFVYRAARKQIILSQQQQNFMMAVTHELKTPIAITRLNLETLQKRALEEQQQQKLITNALQENNRLNTLTNNILVSAQLDTGTYRLNTQPVNFSEITEEVVFDFKNRFPKRNLQLAAEEDIFVKGEATLLQLLVSNLVDNALKYSTAPAPVYIGLNKKNGQAVLTVADEGEGIADEEKKKVFQKFYRTGNEGTRKTKGTGLGLYLCTKIVKDHKGKLVLTDNAPKGVVFTIQLKAL
jgi:two-component system, OmpR family, sensor histidine kinase CiaH